MKLTLVTKKEEAVDTFSFTFEPEVEINYMPGQYFYFTLPKLDQPDPKGATRHFTISSSPTQGKNVMFTTRIRDKSGYKQTLAKLKLGTIIEGSGPEGTFIIDESEKGPHIFLAGGIGATPFRSAIKYSVDKGLKESIYLFTSNGTSEEEPFAQEFQGWDEYNNVSYFHTFTQKGPKDALVGRISLEMITKHVPSKALASGTFWISGPPGFVTALNSLILSSNFTKNIRTESFSGY